MFITAFSTRLISARHGHIAIWRPSGFPPPAPLCFGLLVGNTRPVLSEAQIFDNTLVIDTVAAFDREAEAFLGLIRGGHLQASILSATNLEESASQRATLMDAFIAALQRPNFVFSAWPELRQA